MDKIKEMAEKEYPYDRQTDEMNAYIKGMTDALKNVEWDDLEFEIFLNKSPYFSSQSQFNRWQIINWFKENIKIK